jgi:hypothetical protein
MLLKSLLKRVAIGLGIVVGFVLLLGGLVAGFFWIREIPERARAKRDAQAFMAEINDETRGLAALGNVELELNGITLADLERKLDRPALRQGGAHHTTIFGWACGESRCTVSAIFAVPFEQEVASTSTPVSLIVMPPPFAHADNIAIGGIRVGETVEDVERDLKARGAERLPGKNRAAWDKDWNVVWGDMDGRVSVLVFLNQTMLNKLSKLADGQGAN